MPNPKYQTRLPPDHAEEVDSYADDRGISKAEAVRRLIVAGLETISDPDDETDEPHGDSTTDKEEERIYKLARLGERATLAGFVFLLLGAAVLLGSLAAITQFGLTTGTFGVTLVAGATTACMIGAAVSLGVGAAFIGEAAIRYGVYAGWFGRRLDSYLGGTAKVGA
jgi:hypothetical protein